MIYEEYYRKRNKWGKNLENRGKWGKAGIFAIKRADYVVI